MEKSDAFHFLKKSNGRIGGPKKDAFGGLTKIFTTDMHFFILECEFAIDRLIVKTGRCVGRYFSGMRGYVFIPITRFFKINFCH